MLSTLSRRALQASARRQCLSAASTFHSGPVRRDAAANSPAAPAAVDDLSRKPADVSLEGPLERYGLTDWKVYVPAGLALSVPFLANEWYILSEETQLVAAFIAFSTTVYKYAGGAIGRSLDERQEAIIEEINRLEELELKLYKETIDAATLEKTIVEDLTALEAKSGEMAHKLEAVLAGEVKHRIRDQYVRWLDAAVASEKTGKKALVQSFLDRTAVQVTKNFASDAKLKKAAVDQVVAILKDPAAKQADLVGAEFERVGKTMWEELVKKETGGAAPKEQVATLAAEIKAIKAKGPAVSEMDLDNAVRVYHTAMKGGIKPAQLR
ncbi:hypothetical protein NSK_002112 [Nannochloropsis salina CCMP1776]|uniref:ATP synthase subunit b n=1 Tax=Nannochloropsis salina CCMP1776 TaxID=1027361 RepID=A0A4D9DAH3_9STRA|nr:hypothetical protein NSK_002112 [Nannochloropsis salina CCMP1776]|eukprot:TFJ86455.1 hypothetical protein NSK_002112 [Nannochloropsis salina CCMP1776]